MKKRKSHFVRGFIYLVRNNVTGRVYCGQHSKYYSQGLEPDEIMGKLYFTSNNGLAEEWKSHPEDFEWEVLAENIMDKRELDWREADLIHYMWVNKIPCYNRVVNITLAKRKEDEPLINPLETVNDMIKYINKLVESNKRMEEHLDALEEGLDDVQ